MPANQRFRILSVLSSFVLGIFLVFSLFWFGFVKSAKAAANIRYVAPGGACGSGIFPCYASIQEAVDDAAEGNEVRVAAGNYSELFEREGLTQEIYISKTVTIRGGYTTSDWNTSDPISNPTIVDPQGKGRVIYITGDITPTIDGLHITGGDASGLGGSFFGHDSGGGIYIDEVPAIIENCVIFGNTAHDGGGIHVYQSDAIIQGNIISDNVAINSGGGLLLQYSNARVSSNTIISNTSSQGGGAYAYWDDSIVENNTISNNGSSHPAGGGLYLQGGNNEVGYNLIDNNQAANGGGLAVINSTANVYNNRILSNSASAYGGGLYIVYNAPTLANNVIADNHIADDYYSGSAIYIQESSPDILHNTIVSNTDSNIAAIRIENYLDEYSLVEITNTIIASHTIAISITGGNTLTLNGTLWFDNPITIAQASTATVSMQNQWIGDPLFDLDGYHLTAGSAAQSRGLATNYLTDIDNQPRLSIPDLGADEYWPPGFPKYVYLPTILR